MFHPDCRKCVTARLGLREWYEWTYNDDVLPPGGERVLAWDVTAAWGLVSSRAGRVERREPGVMFELAPLPTEVAAVLLEQGAVDLAHVGHVDMSYPGLIVMVPDEHGGEAAILIDGAHRCVRAYQEGRHFDGIILTREEDQACRISALERAQLRQPGLFGLPTIIKRVT